MSARLRFHLAGVGCLALLAGLALGSAPPTNASALKHGPAVLPYRVGSPITHENLTIFFLFGEDQIKGKRLLTLDEALKTKQVIVHETKNVNELAIENVSDQEVFIQAGDIVKGGQQDRTLALDVLIPPKSGKIPVNSFCVEQGRWAARAGEEVHRFSRSEGLIVGNKLKIAARGDKSQGGVWREVNDTQQKLAQAIGSPVRDPRSQTSLQLTLENKNVQSALQTYLKKFETSLPSSKAGNVLGFAVAINGKVTSADVYANSDLFRRLWPKLLRGAVLEAVSERNEKLKSPPVKVEAVTSFLADVAHGKRAERSLLKDLKEVQQETTRNVLFETRQGKNGEVLLRRSYLAK